MRTEALVFSAPHVCEVSTYELPEDLGRGEVLLRNRLGLISPGTELAIFCRTHRGFEVEGHWARYPYYPGYCSVADVVAVGDRVTALSPGDRVVHQGNHATFARQPAAGRRVPGRVRRPARVSRRHRARVRYQRGERRAGRADRLLRDRGGRTRRSGHRALESARACGDRPVLRHPSPCR